MIPPSPIGVDAALNIWADQIHRDVQHLIPAPLAVQRQEAAHTCVPLSIGKRVGTKWRRTLVRAVQAQRACSNHLRRRLCGQRGAPALRKRQRQRLPLRQAHCAVAHTRLASDLTCFPVYKCKPSPRGDCSVLTDQTAQRQITAPARNQLVTRRRTTHTDAGLAGPHCCRPASAAAAPRSCQTIPSLPPAHAAQNSRLQPCPRKAQL